MRKLNILKAIVDFVWIMSWIILPIIIIVSITMLFIDLPIKTTLTINESELMPDSTYDKIALPIGIVYLGLFIYILFFFRKLLVNFKKLIIFDVANEELLDKIGNLILLNAILYIIIDFIIQAINGKLSIEIGYGPFLSLLGLGLFFKVLAEVFKMGRTYKEENELTI